MRTILLMIGKDLLRKVSSPLGIVVMLAFPGAEIIDIAGPLDILCVAPCIGDDELDMDKRQQSIIVSEFGGPVTTQPSGITIQTEALESLGHEKIDTLIIPGAYRMEHVINRPGLVSWVQATAARARRVVSVCTGAFLLAEAGLLDGKRATIHWENSDSFSEEFEEVNLTKSVFVIDGNRLSTAGGTSSIDLMLKLIANDHGEELANAVADQLIYSSIRTDQDTQRLSIPTRIGVRHPKLSMVIQMMESNIEEPISPSILAQDVGMSTRQLERLFRRQEIPPRPDLVDLFQCH